MAASKLGDLYNSAITTREEDSEWYWEKLYNDIKAIVDCVREAEDTAECMHLLERIDRRKADPYTAYRIAAQRSSKDEDMVEKWRNWALEQKLFVVIKKSRGSNKTNTSLIGQIDTVHNNTYRAAFFFRKEEANARASMRSGNEELLKDSCVF
jgi:hypothetical protein